MRSGNVKVIRLTKLLPENRVYEIEWFHTNGYYNYCYGCKKIMFGRDRYIREGNQWKITSMCSRRIKDATN